MKVLYIGTPSFSDYMSDSLFHGLRSLIGEDIVDGVKIGYMYDDFPLDELNQFWGRGFTLTRKLKDHNIDRTDLDLKIKARYFDYVIYGAAFRDYALNFLQLVVSVYPSNRIVFVNGNDSYRGRVQPELINLPGIHFLRERLIDDHTFPISFSVPKEIIVDTVPEKKKYIMPLIPGLAETYIYSDEDSYYAAYRESLFGLTWKKAGWDCLRHYEILSQGCLPLFLDIHHMPLTLMKTYPRDKIARLLDVAVKISGYAKNMDFHYNDRMSITNVNFGAIQFTDPNSYGYLDIASDVLEYTRKFLTTEYQAKYVLDILKGH
jgi:hypothetical protein